MSRVLLSVTYRVGRPWVAYVSLESRGPRRAVITKQVSPDLVVDFGPDGAPLGIEIITPAAVELEEILVIFDLLGLERPAESELAPIKAA